MSKVMICYGCGLEFEHRSAGFEAAKIAVENGIDISKSFLQTINVDPGDLDVEFEGLPLSTFMVLSEDSLLVESIKTWVWKSVKYMKDNEEAYNIPAPLIDHIDLTFPEETSHEVSGGYAYVLDTDAEQVHQWPTNLL